MGANFNFINEVNHRPWEKPNKKWQYYQEWNDVLFLHFEVEHKDLKTLVPRDVILDSFLGKYYVSVVAFKMQNIRPAGLPAVEFISDFYEINVRTYVKKNNKTGVYFINIEANKKLSAYIAKALSGLPYEAANIVRVKNAYINVNEKKSFYLDAVFEKEKKITTKSELDKWLTERYALFLFKKNKLHLYEVHHKEWDIYNINLRSLDIHYHINSLQLDDYKLIACHYSPGVRVVSWSSKSIA